MSKLINLIGNKFGKWIVVSRAPSKGCNTYWNCICDCGTITEVNAGALCSGRSLQCKRCTANHKTHGKRHTKAYQDWADMKKRCLNSNSPYYSYYGGRGIKIYPEWINDFVAYDMWCNENLGPRPGKGWTKDRIDNNGDYWPGNLRWATWEQQNKNRRPFKKKRVA